MVVIQALEAKIKVKDTFTDFADQIGRNFQELAANSELFYIQTDTDLWDRYLRAFPEGTDPIYRTKTEHDCRYCRNFINGLGNVVAIKNGKIITIWDNVAGLHNTYQTVCSRMSATVRSGQITSVFRTEEPEYGRLPNHDPHDTSIVWSHLHAKVPSKFKGNGAVLNVCNSSAELLNKGMREIKLSAVEQIIELIEENQIYRGEEFLERLKQFYKVLQEYQSYNAKELFGWENYNLPVARTVNNVMGTLLVAVSEGQDLEAAVRSFEFKVDGTNYKRTKALASPKMIEQALKTLKDEGLEQSIIRRPMIFRDLNINDVLWANEDSTTLMQDPLRTLLQAELKPTIKAIPKGGSTVITIEQLLKLRPTEIQLIPTNKHLPNLVTLTTAIHPELSSLFYWENNHAWSYAGNYTDSIKALVKKAGGNVDATYRISLNWKNLDDLDVHYRSLMLGHIYHGRKYSVLDVDQNFRSPTRNAVENLSFNALPDGEHTISVKNFTVREDEFKGFTIEFEIKTPEGSIVQSFYSASSPKQSEEQLVMQFTSVKGQITKLTLGPGIELVSETPVTQWGIKTGRPVTVSTILMSPNHWESSIKQGNRHWFFILVGCKNPGPARTIYNEFLKPSLAKHGKVFDLLATKTKCECGDDQLSGLGFSSTKKATIQALVDKRPYTIDFDASARS
jgi:hypothetical protein